MGKKSQDKKILRFSKKKKIVYEIKKLKEKIERIKMFFPPGKS